MTTTTEKTVREWVLENPAATRVFEKFGIDYCCGGNRTFEAACQAARVQPEHVLDLLDAAQEAARAAQPDRDWRNEPLAGLTNHIRNTHHKYVREETARLAPLFDKVCSVHGAKHPELLSMRATFAALTQELTTHMMKEEMVLFPYIERLEEAILEHAPALPAPFGSVKNPVAMMMHEHDDAGSALRDLRRESGGYTAPDGACITYQTLYKALADFEADLHQHIHLENNILFPRAIEMEQAN